MKEVEIMPKYFMTWEVDSSRMPTDAKERGTMWSGMMEMIKQQMKDGTTLDWGCFIGEARGYSIAEQTELGLTKTLQQYYPFVTFQVHKVMSVDEIAEVAKSLTE
jgi:hypothetical protein